jgi:predicted GIY-YIG superfamily endonuclease
MKEKQWVIYAILAEDGAAVYVGCTSNLKFRKLHHRASGDNRELRDWIKSRPCPPVYSVVGLISDRDKALRVELAYILSLLPEFNKNAGPGSRARSGIDMRRKISKSGSHEVVRQLPAETFRDEVCREPGDA